VSDKDIAIVTSILRSPKGLQMSCQAHAVVEEFMNVAGNGEVSPIEHYGRKWTRQGSDAILQVYDIPASMNGTQMINTKAGYRIDIPGREVVYNDDRSGLKVVNMSFLRLVGVSGPEGVSFNVAGVHSEEDAIWIATQIREASRVIYNQYMKPLAIRIHLEDSLPMREETLNQDAAS